MMHRSAMYLLQTSNLRVGSSNLSERASENNHLAHHHGLMSSQKIRLGRPWEDRRRLSYRLAVVLFTFYNARMWGKRDNLRLSVLVLVLVLLGLRRGLSLCRGMRRALTDDEQHKVADAIVEHLESHNWRIEQGPER
jgi:hypothetical protein